MSTPPVPEQMAPRAAEDVAAKSLDYVVVEGPIGVGKTTLAKRLAESIPGRTLLEAPEENPFLPRFYDNPRAHALSTQLFFLLQRSNQVEPLKHADLFQRCAVADFLVEKDRLFAEINLDADELAVYDEIAKRILGAVPQPDLVIYLQAPVGVLVERIEQRGIEYEQDVSNDYLERLVDAYTRFFYNYDSAPLLIVNASELDFASREQDYHLLLEQIMNHEQGRHYFNPLLF